MSVLIQCKSRLNLKTERYIERLENNRGGKNGPAQSFPTPLLRRNMQLAKCFLNVNFSLEQGNHECSDLNFSLRYVNHECSDLV